MTSNIIIESTKKYQEGSEFDNYRGKAAWKDPYLEAQQQQSYRYPVVCTEKLPIKCSTPLNYGSTGSEFKIPQYSGFITTPMILEVKLGTITCDVSGSIPTFCDGPAQKLLTRIQVCDNGSELEKHNGASIFQYEQRYNKDIRTDTLFANAKIGSTALATLPAAASTHYINIPLEKFSDFKPFYIQKLQNTQSIKIDFANLTDICYSTSGSLTGSILDATLYVKYLMFDSNEKSRLLGQEGLIGMDGKRKPFNQLSEFVDYADVPVASGSTSMSWTIPFGGEVEYMSFYLEDATTHTPFTGTTDISSFYLDLDNVQYPSQIMPVAVEAIDQTLYNNKPASTNIHSFRFTPFPSQVIEYEIAPETFGYIRFKTFSNPKLMLNFGSSLSHNCILHVFALSRAIWVYEGGQFRKIIKS